MASRKFIEILKTKNGRITSVTTDLVKDSDLSLTDITTNNVSITAHGLAPKAPNDATKFLDGTGNYSAPSGSSLGDPVTIAHGGTNNGSGFTGHALLVYSAVSGNIQSLGLSVATDGQLLVGQTSADPSWKTTSGDVTCDVTGALTIAANAVTDAKFRQGTATSVVGRSANSTGNTADITLNADGKFLVRRAGVVQGDVIQAGDVPATALTLAAAGVVRGQIDGLILSDNGAASAQLNYAAGTCRDGTDAYSLTLTAGNKLIATAWAAGSGSGSLDTGAIANNTWYHVWTISKAAGASPDILTSLSATAPTMPSTYTLKRRIGAFKSDSGGKVTQFQQNHDLFIWLVPVLDVSAANPGTAAVLRTLTVPTGVKVQAQICVGFSAATPNTDNPGGILFTDPATTDTAPSVTAATILNYIVASNGLNPAPTYTNTSAQVRSRIQISTAGTTLYVLTFGWLDPRGKDS